MFGIGAVNMAILGTGHIAGTMAKTMKSVSQVKSYAVASRDIDRAIAFGKEHGFKVAYGSYEELLEDKKVKLVYVATPHSEHYENVKACIMHGKAVICEKPFTINAEQAQELIRLAEEKDVFVAEAMWIRFLPLFKKVKLAIDKGMIGEPVCLTASLAYNRSNVRRMINPNLGGGALLDLGIFPLNLAAMVFGDDVSRIHSSCTYTDYHLDEQDSITLKYKDGKMAILNASMISCGRRDAVIQGTKGYIVIENINNFETVIVYNSAHKRIAYYKRPKQNTGLEYELHACVKAMKSGALEVAEMPHSQILSMLNMMDYIRKQMGVAYPIETGVPVVMPGDETPDTAEEEVSEEILDEAGISDEELPAEEIAEETEDISVESAAAEEEVEPAADEEIPEENAAANEPEQGNIAEAYISDELKILPEEEEIDLLEDKIIANAQSDAQIAETTAEFMNDSSISLDIADTLDDSEEDEDIKIYPGTSASSNESDFI